MVGMTGIEPAQSWSQTKRLTIGPHPYIAGHSIGIRTQITWLRTKPPKPLEDGAIKQGA